MKRFEVEDSIIYVGEAADIRGIYKSLWRASAEGRSNILPTFSDQARFNKTRIYGLIIEDGRFDIISGDTAFRIVEADL